jgi:hypothetical protein
MPVITFPSSPSNNELFIAQGKAMRYNSSKNKWDQVSTLSTSQIADLEARTIGVSSMSVSGNTLIIQKDDSSYSNVSLATFSGNILTNYANASVLPLVDLVSGTQVYVTDTNSLFITDGSGWYKVATVNLSPSLTLGVSSISLTSGGSADINYTVVEPEDTPYTITASATSNASITVYQANNTITFNNPSATSTETITISATDGVNVVGDTLTMTITLASWTNPTRQLGIGHPSSTRETKGAKTPSGGAMGGAETKHGMALSGDIAIAGHPNWNNYFGYVNIWKRSSSTWGLLRANDGTIITLEPKVGGTLGGNSGTNLGVAGDRFGETVAIDGTGGANDGFIVVGAAWAQIAGTLREGRIYIYRKYDNSYQPWYCEAYIQVGNDGSNSGSVYPINQSRRFGSSVAISGDYLAVGAFLENNAQTISGTQQGSVRIYKRTGDGTWQNNLVSWTETDMIGGPASGARFGEAVAMSGRHMITRSITAGSGAGKVYAYTHINGVLSQSTTWELSVPGLPSTAALGRSIDVDDSGGTYHWLIAGTGASGNGNQNQAFIWRSDATLASGSNWQSMTTLTAPAVSSPFSGQHFGVAVSIQGRSDGTAIAVIGADKKEYGGNAAGSAYVYEFDGTNWSLTSEILGTGTNGLFGQHVDVDNDTTAIVAQSGDEIFFYQGG